MNRAQLEILSTQMADWFTISESRECRGVAADMRTLVRQLRKYGIVMPELVGIPNSVGWMIVLCYHMFEGDEC